ncbi:MAG: tRNA pseudouridine synthase A [Bacteroidaceae bacterium]|nr:tRNA pseudouridine synthase A [Bacteroidaceae bacterium]
MSSSSSQEYKEVLPPVGGRAAQPMSSSSSQEYKEVLPPVGGRAAEPMSSSSSQEYKEVLPPTGGVREGPPERNLVYRLNGILPHDIAIHRIYPVADDMHARFSALARTYYYYVHTRKSPFLRDRSWRLVKTPDFEAMNRAAATLLEYEDFTSFSKVNTDTKTNICHVRSARWVQLSDYEWRFEITADRFLRNMVRAIVGTLMEVGRGQLSLDGFRKVIEDKNRSAAGDSVPARGLFLQNVEY